MLGRFLNRDSKSALPKNQIEVVCPVCGTAQIEPRKVVTTFCRKCGEHLRIERRGKVVASSQINPVPSSIHPPVRELPAAPVAEPKPPEKPLEKPPEPIVSEALIPDPNVRIADVPLGLGNMMGFSDAEETPAPVPAPPPADPKEEPVPYGYYPGMALGSGAAPPAQPSVLHKMKEQGQFRQHYFKEVECFECHGKFKVGRSAKSTNCPSCGHYICLEDFEINLNSNASIRTRGDVFIRKNGNVQAAEIICRNLRVNGTVAAAIECSGEFYIRASGTLIGDVRCGRLLIDKGSDIHFMNTVHAGEVEIRARTFANIECSGLVKICATGWVHGDVTARSVSIEPGGQLDGAMNIIRKAGVPPPVSPVEVEPLPSVPSPQGELPFGGND